MQKFQIVSDIKNQAENCQVDFYLLGDASAGAEKFACHLALMAWERNHSIFVINPGSAACDRLDEMMWRLPEGRFLPHARSHDPEARKSPVCLGTISDLKPADVVINLCQGAVPDAQQFKRILEIVPFAEDERQASRKKYKTYLNWGIKPQTHEINT